MEHEGAASATEPILLREHSSLQDVATRRFNYRGIRVFFRRHIQADQLPSSPAPLPLIVCIHGFGGSVAQFHSLLSSLVHLAPCLAVDLPGCGQSRLESLSWDAYRPDRLTDLLATVIERHRECDAGQTVILVGHSMGAALAARLAARLRPDANSSEDFPFPYIAPQVVGLVAVCPPAGPPSGTLSTILMRAVLLLPEFLLDLWRRWDSWGGAESASVRRFVGPDAPLELRIMQARLNAQSRTPVFRRMAWGALPGRWSRSPGLPGREAWEVVEVPVFLVAGQCDEVTPPVNVQQIAGYLDYPGEAEEDAHAPLKTKLPVASTEAVPYSGGKRVVDNVEAEAETGPWAGTETEAVAAAAAVVVPPQPRHPARVLRTLVMPAPASHTLLYAPATSRTLAGLVTDFLAAHVTGRLSLAWQLQYLSRELMWDVKNLNKWRGVTPVSEAVGPFRALKTLREADAEHSPSGFAAKWAKRITDVVDISHDHPVYDSRGLERAGVRYHKLPTMSKVPPSDADVEAFVALVDRVRLQQQVDSHGRADAAIGVHCHYGFNRTGYFIVCYLVDRCGLSVQDAIDAFAQARPPGIRHSHFLDRLFVRYCAGLSGS